MEKVLLTPQELSERWGMKPETLLVWRRESKGPAYIKIGSLVRYPLDEVEKYEKENTKQTG